MIHLNNTLAESDSEISELVEKELNRQKYNIELIASENIVSKAVMQATGSILTNKYAEGYPGARYYGGCEFVDEIERIAIERVKKIFNAGFANVQAHSGSQANFAVYGALLSPGDTILGMSLSSGGHLTHGAKVSLSGKWFNAAAYDVDSVSEVIDYDEVLRIALEVNPKIIIAGGSSYSRIIDFKKFREIADKVGAYLMIDMAHFAGMVATGLYPNPLEYADVVTSTTHKTLRGPRGGLILTNNEAIAKKINSGIFPASQGGPLMHIIAAKAVAFKEAMEDSYKDYIKNVVKNSIKMAETFKKSGFRVVSGGTDTHLFMVDLSSSGVSGKIAEKHLETINITLNKNSIPFDKLPPKQTSGIRIGSPCITTRGMREKEAEQISEIIITSLKNIEDEVLNTKLKSDVINLCKEFPIY